MGPVFQEIRDMRLLASCTGPSVHGSLLPLKYTTGNKLPYTDGPVDEASKRVSPGVLVHLGSTVASIKVLGYATHAGIYFSRTWYVL